MAKKVFLLLVTFVMFCSVTLTASAEEDKSESEDNVVVYEGQQYVKNNLSDETLKWLEWYNGLSDELKETVSYVPSDLLTDSLYKTKEGASEVTDFFDKNIQENISPFLAPTGGAEPSYDPDYWNNSSRIKKANCYYYAMQVACNKEGIQYCQPGYLSGKTFTLSKDSIIKAVKADGPYLGNGRSIKKSKYSEQPASNQYKVVLFIAPGEDYHWYIQNRDGYWSHKRGLSKVSNLDASGKKIKTPRKCDKDYGGGLNYSEFCGYYLVTR